jgi:hypothetical protein
MSRKSFGLQSIEYKLSDLLKPIFSGSKKEFILINNLVKNWQEIVGKKYAEFSYPKSVSFNKDKSSGAKLIIAVHNSAVGFFLENNAEIILERIAGFYGFKSITKITIKQEPKNIEAKITAPAKLAAKEEKFLTERISKISDQDLAETLQNLGREILKK